VLAPVDSVRPLDDTAGDDLSLLASGPEHRGRPRGRD